RHDRLNIGEPAGDEHELGVQAVFFEQAGVIGDPEGKILSRSSRVAEPDVLRVGRGGQGEHRGGAERGEPSAFHNPLSRCAWKKLPNALPLNQRRASVNSGRELTAIFFSLRLTACSWVWISTASWRISSGRSCASSSAR